MIQEIMVDIEEQLCTGHGCKNLFQKLKTIGKKKEFSELLKYSMPAIIVMRYICKKSIEYERYVMTHCNGDIFQFNSMLQQVIAHFEGNHRYCNLPIFLGKCNEVGIQSKATYKQLEKVFLSYFKVAIKYTAGIFLILVIITM